MSTLTDAEFQNLKAKVLAAKETIENDEDRLLEEAVKRGEAWTLDVWYFHARYEWHYLTLNDALERAADDCKPVVIISPAGKRYDPYSGELNDDEASNKENK